LRKEKEVEYEKKEITYMTERKRGTESVKER